jgi:predicted O-methyltransferase YrrM
MNTQDLLSRIDDLFSDGVNYAPELLSKFTEDDFAQLNLSYIYGGKGSGSGYLQWLTLLVEHSKAKTIVELGNRYGVSSNTIYSGLKSNQKFYSLDTDIDQRYVPDFVKNDDRVDFITGNCLDLNIYENSKFDIPFNIDILWTDTLHSLEQLSNEMSVYEPLLSNEALIVIDDINLNDKREFFDKSPYEKFDLTSVCHDTGFGVIDFKRNEKDRQLSDEDRLSLALKNSRNIIKKQKRKELLEKFEPSNIVFRIRSKLGRIKRTIVK